MDLLRACGVCAFVFLSACTRSLELPAPPGPPGPGTLYGRLVYSTPGQATPLPAAKAQVQLLSGSLSTTSADDGQFLLAGLTASTGSVLIRFDGDGDGTAERQKLIDLAAVGAGPGRQIALGEVSLGRNAQLRGKIRRADTPGRGGHGGTAVFVPEAPFSAFTNDDGSFTLTELPEGPLPLAAFRSGYAPVAFEDIVLRAGEDISIRELALTIDTAPQNPGTLRGLVRLQDGSSPAGVEVVADDGVLEFTTLTADDGSYRLEALPAGRYDVGAKRLGLVTGIAYNVIVLPGAESSAPEMSLSPGVSEEVDAGPPAFDGGLPDSQLPGQGPVDAGPDLPPTARLSLPTPVLCGSEVYLDGYGSFDPEAHPLTYHWTQVEGPAVALARNDTPFAAAPSFIAPATPAILRFNLTVEDDQSQLSPAATGQMVVATRPVAVLSGESHDVPVGGALQLDASGSSDALPLVYFWSVASGSACFDGASCPRTVTGSGTAAASQTLTFPSVGSARISLVVSNGFFSSAPALFDVTVKAGGSAFTASASPPQTVSYGDTVVVSGTASSGDRSDTFDYSWQLINSPPALDGGVPLTATGPTFSFTAPSQPLTLDYQLSVHRTLSGGGDGGTLFALTHVYVQDLSAPQVVNVSSVDGLGNGSPFYAGFGFSKPVNGATVTPATVQVYDVGKALEVPATLRYDSLRNEVSLVYDRPLPPGQSYELRVNGVHDTVPQPNAPFALPFTSRAITTPTGSMFSPDAKTKPYPGLAFLELPGSQGVPPSRLAILGGRSLGNCGGTLCAMLLSHDPYQGSTLSLEPNSFVLSTGGPGDVPRGRRGLTVGTTAYLFLQSDLSPPGVWLQRAQGAWSLRSTPPGPVFTDGASVFSVFSTKGAPPRALKLAVYADQTDFWTTASATTIDSAKDWAGPTAGAAESGRFIAAAVDSSQSLEVFERPSGSGSWQAMPSPSVSNAGEVRIAFAGGEPFLAVAVNNGGVPEILGLQYDGVGWLSYPNLMGGSATAFDVVGRGQTVYVVAAVGSAIMLRRIELGSGGGGQLIAAPVTEPGPGVGGALNENSGCLVDSPELFFVKEGLWAAWAESCVAGQHQVRLRFLN